MLLELSSSARAYSLSWCDGPTSWVEGLVAAPSVAGSEQACRDVSLLPFVAQMAVAERLGPSHPQSVLVAAESFSSSVFCNQNSSYSNQDLD